MRLKWHLSIKLKIKSHFQKQPVNMLSIFYTKESLFNGLKARKSAACNALINRIEKPILKIARDYGLSNYDAQDFLQYCVTEQLERILDGRYVYQGNWVSSFTINEIATHRIHDYAQILHGKKTEDLDHIDADKTSFEDFEIEQDIYVACKAIVARMSEKCQKLIKLKFEYGFCDEVILEGKMTAYENEEALRKARSKCYEYFLRIAASEKVFAKKIEQLKAEQAAKKFKTIKKIRDEQPK
jgi:hypothetical protein